MVSNKNLFKSLNPKQMRRLMKKGDELWNLLTEWYKPTRKGAKARKILAAGGQAVP
jgi:hypothetical protein